jgi:hypothetical protein
MIIYGVGSESIRKQIVLEQTAHQNPVGGAPAHLYKLMNIYHYEATCEWKPMVLKPKTDQTAMVVQWCLIKDL